APLGKLALAGGLAQAPLALARTPEGLAYLARAEIVLEGVITAEQVPEALPGAPLAGSMPEFLGYDGHGQPALHVLRLTGQRQRPEALFQSVIGPGREQSAILGLGGALALALALPPALGVHDLRFAPAGGGMLLLYAALKPEAPRDLATTAQAMARICPFLKTVIFVDEDVSVQCDEDMLWAMTTRAQLAEDCHPLPGHRPMGMDPSQAPEWQALRGGAGVFKSYVDATVPSPLRPAFRRSLF
ncbi:MAG TPA: UbiD family decarboxylase, partial [Gemmobacter sp.]|nr:UbiD family decarboxylase [Gemmobacter sp.]